MIRVSTPLLAVLLGVACDSSTRLVAPAREPLPAVTETPQAASTSASFLTVSDSSPAMGDSIVVAANFLPPDALHGVASFRARLEYDPTVLEYVGEAAVGSMMRAVNPQADHIVVAGASAAATSDSRLFAIRFRVRSANPLRTLTLVFDELNDGGYTSQLKSLRPMTTIHVDRMLKPPHVQRPK